MKKLLILVPILLALSIIKSPAPSSGGGGSTGGTTGGSATNAIALLGGKGTNTSFFGTTFLVASNMSVSASGSTLNGLLIPNMTSATTPSGVVTSSSQSATAYQAFTNGTWTSDAELTPYLEYQFPNLVTVTGYVMTTSGTTTNKLEVSSDGSTWTTITLTNNNNNGLPMASQSAGTGTYFRLSWPDSTPITAGISAVNLLGYGYPSTTVSNLGALTITAPSVSIPNLNISPQLSSAGVVTTNKVFYPLSLNTYSDSQRASSFGAMVGSMKYPAIGLYFAPYPRHTTGVPDDKQSNVLSALDYLVTNGYTAVWKAQGQEVDFVIDVGWDARRNFNSSFVMTNGGTLMWDTNYFPNGMPWLVQKCATNGIGVILGIYGSAALGSMPNGVSGQCCPVSGGGTIYYYTNGVDGTGTGYVYTNLSSFKAVEVTSPEFFSADVSTMRWWGVRGLIINDLSADAGFFDNFLRRDQAVASEIQNFTMIKGFQQPAGATYFTANFGAIDWTQTNSWTATNCWLHQARTMVDQTSFFTNRFAYLPYTRRANSDTRVFGDELRTFKTGVNYENWAAPLNINQFLTNYLSDYPSKMSPQYGGRALSQIAENSGTYALDAIMSSVIVSDTYGGSTRMDQTMPTLTNLVLLTTLKDDVQECPQFAFSSSDNQLYALRRNLDNGDLLAMFEYRGATNAYQPSVSVTNFGLDPNQTYELNNVVSYQEFSTWPKTNIGVIPMYMNVGGTLCVRVHQVLPVSQPAIDTNTVTWSVNLHAIGGQSVSTSQANNNFWGAPKLGQNDVTAYSVQTEVPNFITQAVSTVTVFYVGAVGQITNRSYRSYYPNGSSSVDTFNSVTVLPSSGNYMNTFSFTNNWPDTNLIKSVNFYCIGASNGTFAYLEKWNITATGPNRGTNY